MTVPESEESSCQEPSSPQEQAVPQPVPDWPSEGKWWEGGAQHQVGELFDARVWIHRWIASNAPPEGGAAEP
jgi:ABC-type antimicrobial peptide transport system ATPase subunit